MLITYTVGAKFWFVPSERRQASQEITIERIGRKWAYFTLWGHTEYRAELGQRTVAGTGSGYATSGTLYASEAEHKSVVARDAAWSSLWSDLDRVRHRGVPEGVTKEQIQQARELLGLKTSAGEVAPC